MEKTTRVMNFTIWPENDEFIKELSEETNASQSYLINDAIRYMREERERENKGKTK